MNERDLLSIQVRVYSPDALPLAVLGASAGRQMLSAAFQFQTTSTTASTTPVAATTALHLGNGEYRHGSSTIPIESVVIEERRLTIMVRGGSRLADLFFVALDDTINAALGRSPEQRLMPLLQSDETIWIGRLEIDATTLVSPVVNEIAGKIGDLATAATGVASRTQIQNLAFAVTFDRAPSWPTDVSLSPKEFRFEPRVNTPQDHRVWFTQSPLRSDAHMRLVAELESHLWASPVSDFTRVIENPDTDRVALGVALYNRAVAYHRDGREADALTDYARLIDHPSVPVHLKAMSLVNRARYYAEVDPERAIADYTAVVSMSDAPPDQRAKAFSNRGILHGRRGDAERELADFSQAIALAGAPPEEKAVALFNRAIRRRRDKQVTEAISDLRSVVATAEAPAELVARALVGLGELNEMLGDRKAELDAYDAVVRMPDAPPSHSAEALINRAVARAELGDVESAMKDLDRVIAMPLVPQEQLAAALFNRGLLRQRVGQVTAAADDYTALIALTEASAKTRADALINRGSILASQGEGDKALADYEAVLAMKDVGDQERAMALFNRAMRDRETGALQRAIDAFSTVTTLEAVPRAVRAQAFANRGWGLYESAGDVAALVADSRAALELDAELLVASFNLGLGLLLSGEAAAAVGVYSEAADRVGTVAELREWGIADVERIAAKGGRVKGATQVLAILRKREEELELRRY